MERKKGALKRITAFMLVMILVITMLPVSSLEAQAAKTKKVSLSKRSVSLYVGKSTKVKLKNVKKKVTWKVISGKKIVSVKKSGKYKNTITLKGKKAGTAKIKATYNKKKYILKVRVKQKTTEQENGTDNEGIVQQPETTSPEVPKQSEITTPEIPDQSEPTTPEKPIQPGNGSEEQPGNGSEEQPGEGNEEQPGEGNGEQPGEGNEEQPGNGNEEQPGNGSEEQPGNGSGEQPGEGSGEEPGNGSEEQPGEGSGEQPGEGSGEEPGNGSEEQPGEGSGEEPGNGSEEQPGEGNEEQPGEGSGEEPGNGSEEQPGEGSGEEPGNGSEEQPGEGSEEEPGEGSGEQPGEGSGEQPGEGSGEQPGEGSEEQPKDEEIIDYEEIIEEETPQNIDLDAYFDKIDTASSSATGEGTETSDKLFDRDVNTKFFTSDACPVRIAWQMKRPVVVKNYTLTTANDSSVYSYRNPLAWHLYGSNDATTWTQIDTVTASGIEAVDYTPYTYETDVQEAFQYYMLQVESNGGYYSLQLAEIAMHGDVCRVTEENGVNLCEYFEAIDNTTTVVGNINEGVENLFDGETTTKLFSATGTPRIISWKMERPTTLYSYTLTTANDNATYTGRNPKAWSLYGSNDGTNWDKIDRVNDSGMKDVNYTPYTYTVDRVNTYQYYKIEFTSLYGTTLQLSEISLKGAAISPSEYDILFTGDWNLITNQGYVDELVKLFYNSYPRLYKRWGTGTEPKTITFQADRNYDGVAYCAGTTVCVSVNYANANPTDIGFFSHEITHSVQQYGGKLNYGDDIAWWTENMANYGGFRYFHWSNPKYVQIYEASDTSLQDWGYEPYGNNKWFFAYMDAKYPTRKDADGNMVYGLIDSINRLIKDNETGKAYTDDPYDTTTPFNQVVKDITGYDCIESLRLKYVEELQNGTWTFEGFANYEDNWITENITGVANPEYPMLGEKIHGNITAVQLATAVTDGINLCGGATVMECSGFTNEAETAEMLIDGRLDTKWCAAGSNVKNQEYKLNGVAHFIKIDLGEAKKFDTYTLYNTQSKEGYGNATEWEVLVSNDAKNWISVDYQGANNNAVASFDIGEQTARYVFIKIFKPDDGAGTLRWYEFQLYNNGK